MAKWSTAHSRRAFAGLLGAALGMLVGGDAGAGEGDPPYLEDAQVLAVLPADSSIDTRYDADIDGDGLMDLAVIGGSERNRKLVVWLGKSGGHEPPLFATLGAPGLVQQSNLDREQAGLIVMDATGDPETRETRAVYRYQRVPGTGSMQLVSLEAERYVGGRATRLDWNLRSGVQDIAQGMLVPSAEDGEVLVPRYAAPRSHRREPTALDIADTPLPDALIDAELRASPGRD